MGGDVPSGQGQTGVDHGLGSLFALMLVTDGRGDPDRLEEIVVRAVRGGVTCVQLREPHWSADEFERFVTRVQQRDRTVELLTNTTPVRRARGLHLPARFLAQEPPELPFFGYAVHNQSELESACRARATYAILAPVLPTTSKPGVPSIGLERARELTARSTIPVIWLGGFDETNVPRLRDEPCAGIAVRSALCDAADPGVKAQAIRDVLENGPHWRSSQMGT